MKEKKLKKIKIFCDGSVNPQKKIGYGAYLLIEDDKINIKVLKEKIVLKKFEDTSSTKLEMETFLWAINDLELSNAIIEIYTDCQNIIGLENRREKLEKNDYKSGKGKIINNHDLYKKLFLYKCAFIYTKIIIIIISK